MCWIILRRHKIHMYIYIFFIFHHLSIWCKLLLPFLITDKNRLILHWQSLLLMSWRVPLKICLPQHQKGPLLFVDSWVCWKLYQTKKKFVSGLVKNLKFQLLRGIKVLPCRNILVVRNIICRYRCSCIYTCINVFLCTGVIKTERLLGFFIFNCNHAQRL